MKRETMLARFEKWTLSKCLEATAKDLQLLVRMEAADGDGFAHCCSCGRREHYKKMNGGHFISRQHKATMLDRQNVHAQCVRCNCMDNLPGYSAWLEATYGKGFTLELMDRGRHLKQWTRGELVDLRMEFKRLIKIEKQRLGVD